MNELGDLDYWHLNDDLSVTIAVMLAAGIDPGEYESTNPSNPIGGSFHIRGGSNLTKNYIQSGRFIAVFSAVRSAILSSKLKADISHVARAASYVWVNGEPVAEAAAEDEDTLRYDVLLTGVGTSLRSNVSAAYWGRYETVLFLKEPDWSHTSVNVAELTAWMERRNFRPPFFFPDVAAKGFRDRNHPRYSPKLACAVGAWEAVERSKPNMSVKATIVEWVSANAVTFGMAEADGVPSATGVEEVAKVANWETRGGANRTGGDAVEAPEPMPPGPFENFTEQPKLASHRSKKFPVLVPGDLDDSDR